MREADAVAVFFGIFVENKGLWDFLGGELYDFFVVSIREIFFGNRGDGCRIGIKDTDNILDTNVLIVSNVKIHRRDYFLTI